MFLGFPCRGREDFLNLLDQVLENLPRAPPVLCGTLPAQMQPGDAKRSINPTSRLVVLLRSRDHHAISVGGERRDVVLRPGQCIYFAANAWAIPFFDAEADVFSAVILPWCVRLVRFRVSPPNALDAHSYHTSLPASPAATHVAGALDALTERGDCATEARDLLAVLLRLLRKQVAHDVPVNHLHWRTLMTWHSVREHLEENFGVGITRASVAKSMDLNPSYLSTLTRRHSGQSFHEILEGIRMSHARRLLMETDLKLAAIARECGYRDAARFAKVFRRVFGATAGRFRAQRQNEGLIPPLRAHSVALNDYAAAERRDLR